ncbi:MAG TPA: DUF429 domain-containing protein [Solirubrobacteraceae bacterium]|nr:DUF429 domain-containing protein [Solirubrobacteraceae bacterium]
MDIGLSTLGIDLASQPETTGVCLLRWHAEHVEVPLLARHRDAGVRLDDARLLTHMLGTGGHPAPAKIGIDAPLGWPVAFVAAVGDPDAWPLEEEVPPGELVARASDRWVRQRTGKVPLSVSSDRIAYPAMRAQRLLRRLAAATGERPDRSGMSGRVCEVYPDPAVTRFGLRPAGGRTPSYKGPGGEARRAEMLPALLAAAPWLALSAAQQADCVRHDDVLDALLAALITAAVLTGLSEPPPPELGELARAEGWIHLPRAGALERLAPQRS